MKTKSIPKNIAIALILGALTSGTIVQAAAKESTDIPRPLDMEKASEEIETHYSKAHPEVQEYVRMTARTFRRNGLWPQRRRVIGTPGGRTRETNRLSRQAAERR